MASKNPFSLTPAWPEDLPKNCGKCGQRYDIRSSLEIGPGPTGRFIRKYSPWMCVVMIVLMFLTRLEFLSGGGNGGAMAFAAAIVVPTLLLNIWAGILPKRTRLYCHRCGSKNYHPVPVNRDNRIPVVDE